MTVKTKRAYVPDEAGDGIRILVDRLWPRGLAKESARIDLWLKDIAPSNELRKWFNHDPKRWPTFRIRYFWEIDSHTEVLAMLIERVRKGTVTLVYAARDERCNNAVALNEYLSSHRSKV